MILKENSGTLYTDGSFLKKSGECGWAFLLGIKEKNKDKFISSCGYVSFTESSYHAELIAIIEALKIVPAGSEILLRCDHKGIGTRASDLAIQGYYHAKHCKKLWREYLQYVKNINLIYRHIKAHRHNIFNDYCDKLAHYAVANKLEFPLVKSFKTLSELMDFHCCSIRA